MLDDSAESITLLTQVLPLLVPRQIRLALLFWGQCSRRCCWGSQRARSGSGVSGDYSDLTEARLTLFAFTRTAYYRSFPHDKKLYLYIVGLLWCVMVLPRLPLPPKPDILTC